MTKSIFTTWMISCADMIAYHTRRYALFAWFVLVIANIITVTVVVDQRRDNARRFAATDRELCIRFTRPLHDIIVRSNKSIPTLSYYRTHPDELEKVMNQNRLALKEFDLSTCHTLPSDKAK